MVRWLRWSIAATLAAGSVATVPATAEPARQLGFDRAAWHADLDELRAALTREYPNLEWAVERGMDLPALERRARGRLDAATEDHQARAALERFVRAFGDGHLALSWPAGGQASDAARAPQPICERLGYVAWPDDGAIASRLAGYTSITPDEGAGGAGIVSVAGRRIGVLRLPVFAPSGADCAKAVAEAKLTPNATCDEACTDRLVRRADALFLEAVEARVRALVAQRPDVLLVDIARNGGGNDSAIAIARMLGGDLPTPIMARMRGERLAADLADDRADLRNGLRGAAPGRAALLRRLDAALAAAEAEARSSCDRSPLWRGERVACSGLVRGPFFAGGLSDRDVPGLSAGNPADETISSTARFRYTPGLWRGPLVVLVDDYTASAAELFAAMLQDAGRAIVVGAPTVGAGCGWMLPPRAVTLPNSRGQLSVPDCARFRADGRNEVDGIEPDVLVGFRPFDTPRQKVGRLAVKLGSAVASAMARSQPVASR